MKEEEVLKAFLGDCGDFVGFCLASQSVRRCGEGSLNPLCTPLPPPLVSCLSSSSLILSYSSRHMTVYYSRLGSFSSFFSSHFIFQRLLLLLLLLLFLLLLILFLSWHLQLHIFSIIYSHTYLSLPKTYSLPVCLSGYLCLSVSLSVFLASFEKDFPLPPQALPGQMYAVGRRRGKREEGENERSETWIQYLKRNGNSRRRRRRRRGRRRKRMIVVRTTKRMKLRTKMNRKKSRMRMW